MPKILVFGVGWIGNKYKEYLVAEITNTDITDKTAVENILDKTKPEFVINTAGKTGRPNIDWCEEHKLETMASNTLGPLNLARACIERNIHFTQLSSGCIFTGTSPKKGGFTEEDTPNPISFYSLTKTWADEVLKHFPVLILRLRMPVTGEVNPRNLITKLASYKKIIDVENSMTVIDDLLLATKQLITKKKTGIYNLTNPGTAHHREIMQWYKEIVDPTHTNELIPARELQQQGLAKTGRSNCILNTDKLRKEGILLPDIKERIKECLHEYKKTSVNLKP